MPLSLGTALIGAYKFLWDARQDLWSYAFLPIVLVAATQTVTLWLLTDWQTVFEQLPPPQEGSPENPMGVDVAAIGTAGVINLIVGLIAYFMFAVAWHRRYLVGNEGQTVGAALRWGPRHWKYAGRFFAIMLIIAGAAFLFSLPLNLIVGANPTAAGGAPLVLFVAVFTIFILIGLVYGRLLLVLPAAAKDDPIGLRESFERTRGKSWLMLAIGMLPPLPILIVAILVVSALQSLLTGIIGPSVSLLFVLTLIDQTFTFAAIAAGVTALSIAYRELVDSGFTRSV